jgi:hypothetical protein
MIFFFGGIRDFMLARHVLYRLTHTSSRGLVFFVWADLDCDSSNPCLPSSWDYRCDPLCPAWNQVVSIIFGRARGASFRWSLEEGSLPETLTDSAMAG